jgi:hypothetical protein
MKYKILLFMMMLVIGISFASAYTLDCNINKTMLDTPFDNHLYAFQDNKFLSGIQTYEYSCGDNKTGSWTDQSITYCINPVDALYLGDMINITFYFNNINTVGQVYPVINDSAFFVAEFNFTVGGSVGLDLSLDSRDENGTTIAWYSDCQGAYFVYNDTCDNYVRFLSITFNITESCPILYANQNNVITGNVVNEFNSGALIEIIVGISALFLTVSHCRSDIFIH